VWSDPLVTHTQHPRKRRWFGLPKRVAAGFVLAFVSLAAAALCSMLAMRARAEATYQVEDATEELVGIEEVQSALMVSDVALDAYIEGGDKRYRVLHLRARGKLDPALKKLSVRMAEDPRERELLEGARPTLARLTEAQDRALALADRGDRAAARALRRRTAGALDGARDLFEALERNEEQEIASRRYASGHTELATSVVFHGAQAVLLVLVLVAARVVRDEIRKREAREAERAHALEVQQRLVAVVSHDLRNPLSGILTAAWALARTDLPEDARRVARRIAAAGRRMERLIRDLLDWSRANAGADIPVEMREADLFEVCVRVAEDMGDSRNSRIELVRAGDTRAAFDPDRMEQVVSNLLSNALKYGAPDRPRCGTRDRGSTPPSAPRCSSRSIGRRGAPPGRRGAWGSASSSCRPSRARRARTSRSSPRPAPGRRSSCAYPGRSRRRWPCARAPDGGVCISAAGRAGAR
jgi:signal transduction histidine kinase